MQHGGGQDQSDWMNMGNVPVIMDNLLEDGTTEPAVVITTNTNYLGPVGNQAVQGDAYPNLRNVVIPFVEANYNVSTEPIERAFAGLSAGSFVTQNLIRDDADLFGYWGPWSGGVSVPASTPNLAAPYIQYGGGAWDFGLPNPNTVAALDQVAFVENTVVAGAHDFNAWNQLFTIFARDYLWQPEAFVVDEITQLKNAVAGTSLNKGNANALTVKLDQALQAGREGRERRCGGGLDRTPRPGECVHRQRKADGRAVGRDASDHRAAHLQPRVLVGVRAQVEGLPVDIHRQPFDVHGVTAGRAA